MTPNQTIAEIRRLRLASNALIDTIETSETGRNRRAHELVLLERQLRAALPGLAGNSTAIQKQATNA